MVNDALTFSLIQLLARYEILFYFARRLNLIIFIDFVLKWTVALFGKYGKVYNRFIGFINTHSFR